MFTDLATDAEIARAVAVLRPPPFRVDPLHDLGGLLGPAHSPVCSPPRPEVALRVAAEAVAIRTEPPGVPVGAEAVGPGPAKPRPKPAHAKPLQRRRSTKRRKRQRVGTTVLKTKTGNRRGRLEIRKKTNAESAHVLDALAAQAEKRGWRWLRMYDFLLADKLSKFSDAHYIVLLCRHRKFMCARCHPQPITNTAPTQALPRARQDRFIL